MAIGRRGTICIGGQRHGTRSVAPNVAPTEYRFAYYTQADGQFITYFAHEALSNEVAARILERVMREECSTQTEKMLEEVLNERRRQNAKWGPQTHSVHYWLSTIMEELGEAAEASIADTVDLKQYRRALIHVAAVAVAAAEDIDGNPEGRNT